MKVLKNNYNNHQERVVPKIESYPRTHICENCGSELEYEKSDLYTGFLGCMHLTCPLCGMDNMLEDNEGTIKLTADNVEFPAHFWHTSKETGAVECCTNEEVRDGIRKAVKFFREHKEESYWYTSTGDLFLAVYRHDGDEDYWVVVSNNFYETYIPFESADYAD